MGARQSRYQRGTSLVEVLVTMVILSIGLLALVVLHGRLHLLQMESYQRSQALILLNDMASRISLNRNDVDNYLTVGSVGVGAACPATGPTRQEADLNEWCNALQGAAETLGLATQVGAMIGGRGCIEDIGGDEYLVTVAWQGQAPIAAPPASVTCGFGAYDGAGTPCVNDLCRRVVTTVVRIATLT